jgi:DNA gyrase subunit A
MATRDEDFVHRLFVADTHRPLLFFSTRGMVYKIKVYRLPLGTPQARGKALVNLLPLQEGETISTVLPLPADEASWGETDVMFATASGYVRRNTLSDFVDVKANGKIAMKLEEGDRLIGVSTCTEANDVLLAASGGRCIRFPVSDVRVFSSRSSTGVRGIRLADKDQVISLSILHHMDAETEEREGYLRYASAQRRGQDEEAGTESGEPVKPPARLDELRANEEFILTVTTKGYGKRSSAYEYRITGRGGQGIANIERSERNGDVSASFPVADNDQIMLVTDGGQLIRCPVNGIRIAGRSTQGVIVFNTAEDEKVVSVERIGEEGEDNGGN